MDKSSRISVPSLRDTLLKAAVTNFDKCFLNTDQVQGHVFKAGVVLPPHLFEDIQLKGNEIGWPIPTQFLKHCLAYRDALNWVKVDLFHGFYEVSDLLKVQESNLPLKQFSFRVNLMKPELIRLLRKYSATFEILKIGYHSRYTSERCIESEDFEFEHYESPMKFPALKKLLIDFKISRMTEMIYIDFASCSESLESLETNCLGNAIYGDSRMVSEWNFFIDSFKHLHNLKSLTLKSPIKLPNFFDYFGHLKNLRSLNILDWSCNKHKDWRLSLKCFPRLEYCNYTLDDRILEFTVLETEYLKYFGFLSNSVWVSDEVDAEIEKFAKTVVSYKSLSSSHDLLTTGLEHLTRCDMFSRIALEIADKEYTLYLSLGRLSHTHIQKAENIILILIQKYWSNAYICQVKVAWQILCDCSETDYKWSTEFIKKFVNLAVNFSLYVEETERCDKKWDLYGRCRCYMEWGLQFYPEMVNYMLEHIEKNSSKPIAKCYLKYLLLSNLYHCEFDIRNSIGESINKFKVSSIGNSKIQIS